MKESKWTVHEPGELKTEYRDHDYKDNLAHLVQNPIIITDNGENQWGTIGGVMISDHEIFKGHRYTMYVGLSEKGCRVAERIKKKRQNNLDYNSLIRELDFKLLE